MENPVGRRIGLNPVPDVHIYNTSTPVSQLRQPTPDEYNQFNLQNINAPTPPKWKNSENILKDFKKFKKSCMHIFDGPMAHITNVKVKTNMYQYGQVLMGKMSMKSFNCLHLSNTIWMQFLKPLKEIASLYFCAARFKFRAVKQHQSETINTFYHQILHLARQCQFENINECLTDAIVFGCKSKKVQDKFLQMPMQMTLEVCLLICRHYKSLQWHINTVRPTGEIRAMNGLTRLTQSLNPEVVVIQEGLNLQLYIQTNLKLSVLHVALYIKLGNALLCHKFVLSVTSKVIFLDCVDLP